MFRLFKMNNTALNAKKCTFFNFSLEKYKFVIQKGLNMVIVFIYGNIFHVLTPLNQRLNRYVLIYKFIPFKGNETMIFKDFNI